MLMLKVSYTKLKVHNDAFYVRYLSHDGAFSYTSIQKVRSNQQTQKIFFTSTNILL